MLRTENQMISERQTKQKKGLKFKQLVAKLRKQPEVRDPQALAAWIGRRKYGKKKFKQLSRKESVDSMIDQVLEGATAEDVLANV